MPWQGHIYIGQKVRSYEEARSILANLDDDPDRDWDSMDIEALRASCFDASVHLHGNEFHVCVGLMEEWEGGDPYTYDDSPDAMVGFGLTSRYKGSILDKDCENGQTEPFEFDPSDITEILSQVRKWWPEAKAIIWTVFH